MPLCCTRGTSGSDSFCVPCFRLRRHVASVFPLRSLSVTTSRAAREARTVKVIAACFTPSLTGWRPEMLTVTASLGWAGAGVTSGGGAGGVSGAVAGPGPGATVAGGRAAPPPPLPPAAAGTTALDGVEAGPVPAAFDAVTVNVYAVPFARPPTVIGLFVPVAVVPPGERSDRVDRDRRPTVGGGRAEGDRCLAVARRGRHADRRSRRRRVDDRAHRGRRARAVSRPSTAATACRRPRSCR